MTHGSDSCPKLLTPNRKRRAVMMLRDRFGVSERRACRVVGRHRSTHRLEPASPDDAEQRPRAWRRDFADAACPSGSAVDLLIGDDLARSALDATETADFLEPGGTSRGRHPAHHQTHLQEKPLVTAPITYPLSL